MSILHLIRVLVLLNFASNWSQGTRLKTALLFLLSDRITIYNYFMVYHASSEQFILIQMQLCDHFIFTILHSYSIIYIATTVRHCPSSQYH